MAFLAESLWLENLDMQRPKSIFDRYPPEFKSELEGRFPQQPSSITITIPKRMGKTSAHRPVAFYVHNSLEHLTSFDADGQKIQSQQTESTPTKCLVLSNGVVVMTFEGKEFGNVTLETIQPTGEKQIISLPEHQQQEKEPYELVEFPKNCVCVWRQTGLFIFDPLNPFTTHQSFPEPSNEFQQLDGRLILHQSNLMMSEKWIQLKEGKDNEIEQSVLFEPTKEQSVWKWISSTTYLNSSFQLGSIEQKYPSNLPLKPYIDNLLGDLFCVVDRHYVLVAQWPSWNERSTQVRLTVFDTNTTPISIVYENLTWFNNQRVGQAPMRTIIGAFSWPYLQVNKMHDGSDLEIFNLKTNKLLCACTFTTPCDEFRTIFLGDLAILQSDGEYDILNLKRDTNRSLRLREGRMFFNQFVPEPEPKPIEPEKPIEQPKLETPTVVVINSSPTVVVTPPTVVDLSTPAVVSTSSTPDSSYCSIM